MLTIEIYGTFDEKVKFRAKGDKRVRTSKVRYDNDGGDAWFYGFGGQKFYFKDFVRTNNDFGDKSAECRGVLGVGSF